MGARIGADKALSHVERLARWKAGHPVAPVTVEWDLSNRCYLGCQSCHFAHTHVRGPWASSSRVLPMAWEGTGDLADAELVERGLSEMAACGVLGVIWSGGGEPTTHPDWMRILRHAKAVGLEQGMYTAGGLLTPETAPLLAQTARWVVVSLDAADAQTYAQEKRVGPGLFEKACTGIRLLAEAGGDVGVSFLLHAGNWADVWNMLHLARSLGACYATFRPTIETRIDDPAQVVAQTGWVTEAEQVLGAVAQEPDVECDPSRFRAYRDWRVHGRGYRACHGIKLNATVTPDGRVWVCPQRRGLDGASLVGDLRTESFAALWARHPGVWTDFSGCRAMCRLHLVNEAVAPVFEMPTHAAFV